MILVTGATGFIGRNVVQRLLAENLPVRCLVAPHRTSRIPWNPQDEHAPEIIVGSLLEDEVAFRAVTGVHTIIHLENAMWWGRERNLERMEISGTRNMITVARSARVGRIIYLSHLGAAPSSAYTLHRIKGQAEEAIRNSGIAYTILRSGLVFGPGDAFLNHIAMALTINPLFFFMPGQGDVVLHPIYIDDLVQCVYRSLELIETVDTTIEVGGQEYITLEDLLLTLMRVTNKTRIIVPLPPYFLRLVAHIFARLFPRTLMSPQWLDILATNRTTQLSNVYDYFSFQPRRIEDTLVLYMHEQNYFVHYIRYLFRRRPRES